MHNATLRCRAHTRTLIVFATHELKPKGICRMHALACTAFSEHFCCVARFDGAGCARTIQIAEFFELFYFEASREHVQRPPNSTVN